MAYTALTAKYLSLNDEEITNQQAFLEKCSKIPLDLQLCYRYVPEMPLGWPIDLLGVFPAEGIGIPIVIVVYVVALLIAKLLPTYTNFLALIKTKIPSGHRSITGVNIYEWNIRHKFKFGSILNLTQRIYV